MSFAKQRLDKALIQDPTTKWVFYIWIDQKRNIVSFIMVLMMWNSPPDVLKVNVSFQMFKSKVRNLYRKIFGNIDAEHHDDYIFFLTYSINCFSSVIVLGFKYWTIKFPIVSLVVIIRIVIEFEFVPVSVIIVIENCFNTIGIVIGIPVVYLLYLIRLGLG